jgi:hypothetical protein
MEEATKLEQRLEEEKAEKAKKQLESDKAMSKTFALEKAEYRHKKLEKRENAEYGWLYSCIGHCHAEKDSNGWWHWGCSSHCFCDICKKSHNSKWLGVD